jgi:hypothetical protein
LATVALVACDSRSESDIDRKVEAFIGQLQSRLDETRLPLTRLAERTGEVVGSATNMTIASRLESQRQMLFRLRTHVIGLGAAAQQYADDHGDESVDLVLEFWDQLFNPVVVMSRASVAASHEELEDLERDKETHRGLAGSRAELNAHLVWRIRMSTRLLYDTVALAFKDEQVSALAEALKKTLVEAERAQSSLWSITEQCGNAMNEDPDVQGLQARLERAAAAMSALDAGFEKLLAAASHIEVRDLMAQVPFVPPAEPSYGGWRGWEGQ